MSLNDRLRSTIEYRRSCAVVSLFFDLYCINNVYREIFTEKLLNRSNILDLYVLFCYADVDVFDDAFDLSLAHFAFLLIVVKSHYNFCILVRRDSECLRCC